jgi:hypothetical protein
MSSVDPQDVLVLHIWSPYPTSSPVPPRVPYPYPSRHQFSVHFDPSSMEIHHHHLLPRCLLRIIIIVSFIILRTNWSSQHSLLFFIWSTYLRPHVASSATIVFCHYFLEVCVNEFDVNGFGLLVAYLLMGSSAILQLNHQTKLCHLAILLLLFHFTTLYFIHGIEYDHQE